MRPIFIIGLFLGLIGCAQMIPGLTQALEDYVTDEAVNIKVDKAAMQKDTDIKISVDIMNKDQPAQLVVAPIK
jgi:hypothetical protein